MTITIRRAYPVMIILYLALTLAGCATTPTTSARSAGHALGQRICR